MNHIEGRVMVNTDMLSLLMYVDDIVVLSDNTQNARCQLDVMSSWCSQWGMQINAKKSQILHIRHHQKRRNITPLYCCGQRLEYVDAYKYHIHKHLSHDKSVHILTQAVQKELSAKLSMYSKSWESWVTILTTHFTTAISFL